MQVAVAVCPLALWKEKYLCNTLQAQCCKLTQHRKSSMHIVALTGRSVNYVKKCVTLFKLFFFFQYVNTMLFFPINIIVKQRLVITKQSSVCNCME